MGKTKGFIKKARVRALPQATKSLEGEYGFKFVRGGRGGGGVRAEGEGGGEGGGEGVGKGGYRFSSLLKQKIKGKILLRHLHRRIFFLKIFML